MIKIPRDPNWCSFCVAPEQWREAAGPCQFHRGPKGETIHYAGPDAYDPSEWVLEVVGKRYRGSDRTWVCFGYDPRHGFWMQTVDEEAPERKANVSERAIGRTFHPVRMTSGAERLLGRIQVLGRIPAGDEADGIALDLALDTLRRCGFVTKQGRVTPAGREEITRLGAQHE